MAALSLSLILLGFLFSSPSTAQTTAPLVPALFIFGDSTVDSGNNNELHTISKANFHPNGRDFPGGKATGRFCNGKLATDFLSEKLGLPDTVPAYLDPQFNGSKLLTGASFASAASGFYDGTAEETNVLTMAQELALFRRYKAQLAAMEGSDNAMRRIQRGLFVLSAGTVDFTNVYYALADVRQRYSVAEFQGILLQGLRNFTDTVYAEGGRRLLIIGLPPFGCLPSQITLHNLVKGKCVDAMNDVAASTNVQMQALMASMQSSLPGLSVNFVGVYDLLLDMSQNPIIYGFEEGRRGCCGTGLLEASITCNPTTPTCRDATKFVYWDSYHPTTSAYSILADRIVSSLRL